MWVRDVVSGHSHGCVEEDQCNQGSVLTTVFGYASPSLMDLEPEPHANLKVNAVISLQLTVMFSTGTPNS
jgi:hypothetical protein